MILVAAGAGKLLSGLPPRIVVVPPRGGSSRAVSVPRWTWRVGGAAEVSLGSALLLGGAQSIRLLVMSAYIVFFGTSLTIRVRNPRAACACFGWSRRNTVTITHIAVLAVLAGVAGVLAFRHGLLVGEQLDQLGVKMILLGAVATGAAYCGLNRIPLRWQNVAALLRRAETVLVGDRAVRRRVDRALRRPELVDLIGDYAVTRPATERWKDGQWAFATFPLEMTSDDDRGEKHLVLAVTRRIVPASREPLAAAVVDLARSVVIRQVAPADGVTVAAGERSVKH